jgi:hypothetical protein
MTVREERGTFSCQGRRLAYRVYGEGPRVTVLLHGLLLVALTIGEPVMKLVSRIARPVPEERAPWAANVLLDTVRQDPEPIGRTAPPRTERRTFTAPR